MFKRFLCCFLAMMFLCSFAVAETATYSSTKDVMAMLDAKDIKYTFAGMDNAKYEVIEIKNTDSDINYTYTIKLYMDDTIENSGIRVWDVITYSATDFSKVLRVCNTINCDYKYVTFVADESDNTVYAEMDLIYRTDSVGEIHWEAILYMVDVLGENYEALAVYNK